MSGNWWDLGITPLDNFGGAPSLPTLFEWDAEAAEALPATATFTRASTAQVLTTTDGTTNWYQLGKSGELRLDGLRRVQNSVEHYDDLSQPSWGLLGGATLSGTNTVENINNNGDGIFTSPNNVFNGQAIGGRKIWLSFTGSGNGTIRLRIGEPGFGNSQSFTVSLTAAPQRFAFARTFATSSATGISVRWSKEGGGETATTITLSKIMASEGQIDGTEPLSEDIDTSVTYNADVPGVRYFNTTNGNSVDGNGVVTEAAGSTITGGGYLPEPAATNTTPHSFDFSAWTANALANVTDNGIDDIGLNSYTIEADTTNDNHRVLQNSTTVTNSAFAVVAKAGTGRYMILRGTGSSPDFACFDLQTGTVSELGGGINVVSASVQDLKNGWYYCSLICNVGQAANRIISISDTATPGSGTYAYLGANETIKISHAQVEDSLFNTSPIITNGSTVTRVADVLSDSTAHDTPYSVFADVTYPLIAQGASPPTVFGFAGGGPSDRLSTAGNSENQFTTSNGLSMTVTKSSGNWAGTRVKVAASYEVDDGVLSATDAPSVTDATGTPNTGADISIGCRTANDRQWRGRMHVITTYDVAQTQSELEDLVS